MRRNVEDLLASYMDALFPIIYINHFDFEVIDDIIKRISDGRNIIEFDNGLGEVDFETQTPGSNPCSLVDFLYSNRDEGYTSPTIMVLKDVHDQISTPEVIGLLKYIAERNLNIETYNQTVFIMSSKLVIPTELENYITVYDFPLPDYKEIEETVATFAKDYEITVDDKTLRELAVSFKGLSEFQIRQILNVAYQDGGKIDSDDKELILNEKKQLIKKAGILETIEIREGIKDIGGLENLKQWLYKKACIFNNLDDAMQFGVDTPKGIMIVGMPGCGKSLAAKATAKLFDVPLVRLDIGRLMGKFVGESEENMRRALKLAEAISPCVLWIDEIEKAFSGIGGSGGGSDVTTRLFGQFLTWMQEKENTVFIVATANDISKIPPEFLRKGRFDELFFVDFPNAIERKKILEIHLRKRDVWHSDLDLNAIAEKTDGYNGADLEAIVKDAVEKCFVRHYVNEKSDADEKLSTSDLQDSLEEIESISKTLGKRIDEIKKAVEELYLKDASSRAPNFVAEPCVKNAIKKARSHLANSLPKYARGTKGHKTGSSGHYDVRLVKVGKRKLAVVETISKMMGIGTEAAFGIADAVEQGGVSKIKTNVTAEEAAKITEEFEKAGATVKIEKIANKNVKPTSEKKEEHGDYTVHLEVCGSNLKAVTNLVQIVKEVGNNEAKKVVYGYASRILKTNATLQEAERIKKMFEGVGATIRLDKAWHS